jgi:MarR family transcriptional regulator for hemolysin
MGFDPNDSIGFHCAQTYRAFLRGLDKRLKGTGISPAQHVALAYLTAFGPMPQSQLAAELSITPVSVVRLIDRLERDGWVERQPSTKDRRVKLVIPTAKAEAVWDELKEHAEGIVNQANRGIPRKDIAKVKEVLLKVRENLGG